MGNYDVREYESKQEDLMKETDVNVIIHHFDSREFLRQTSKRRKNFLATFQRRKCVNKNADKKKEKGRKLTMAALSTLVSLSTLAD
jgi:hypothetical protein